MTGRTWSEPKPIEIGRVPGRLPTSRAARAVPLTDYVSGALSLPGFGPAYDKTVTSGAYEKIALWFIDVRNFRSVNPKFGYFTGNTVLQAIAEGIRASLSHELPVARLGGDRFILLTSGLDFDEALEQFRVLITCLEEKLAKMGVSHPMVLSAGIYYLREGDYQEPRFQRALDYASIAHRKARNDPRSRLILFTDEDLERDARRITIEQSIDRALEDGQIQVWYQPQVDYAFGEVIGAEALARWNHPELGWISPAEFIPALEACGKVHDLDLFVWEEACRSAGRWHSVSDGKPVPISVNVSRAEMFEPELMEHFLELQKKYDLPKGSLRLEITESAFVEEAERLYGIIEKMRDNDMLVEMDDFGSGLSSLNMLKDIPVDVVKLDMGFMRSTIDEERGGVVLSSVIRMLQGLDTPIIAEGVETLEQAEMLKNMGCHLMQGFHFSKPMPLEEFENFMASSRAVESARRRRRKNSHLEDLMSIDASSSYLFNYAIGGTMFFFAGEGTSESILVNDRFYEDCGLNRSDFGDAKVNPIDEIDSESRSTLWRAAAEAREYGSAVCHAKVRLTKRWIDCVIRFVGTSSRGDIYSINILRSGDDAGTKDASTQRRQDLEWNISLLKSIVPNGFVKCRVNDSLDINYISPELYEAAGLPEQEFIRRFHNSFAEAMRSDDQAELFEDIAECRRTGKTISREVSLHYGYGSETRDAYVIGNVQKDGNGVPWLYALVLLTGSVTTHGDATRDESDRIIPFDYLLKEDRLVIHPPKAGAVRDCVTIENWSSKLDRMPDNISKSSAAKVLATIRDLQRHPASGFSDIKCNLRGGDSLRWYHIDYTCETDDEGRTTILHGYAQDANDQMGSARWWRRQAESDQLTGLLNRNASEQSINLSMRIQGAGMMFMIDLDGFKRVNDELGHLAGDALLKGVAFALSKSFREGDVLGRYGGDEFVAFVPLIGGDARKIAAHRAAEVISSVSQVETSDGVRAACSVGVALSHRRDATFYDLLEVADKALYQSKETGKGIYTILDAD